MVKMRIVFLVFIVTAFAPFMAQAQSPQQTLTQYISDLQKNPNDNALREKIIRHVQGMNQKPAVPGEVIKYEGAAEYAFKSAKNESDYLASAQEFEKALLMAPWLASDYFNCGVAYERAGRFKEAINSFNFYLVSSPDAKDKDVVLKRIGGLDYADKRAAKEASQVVIAEKPKADLDVSGRWRVSGGLCSAYNYFVYRWDGDKLIRSQYADDKVITDGNCQALSQFRGRMFNGEAVLTRSGKNTFSYSSPSWSIQVEFVADKAFVKGGDLGGVFSSIEIRER
jgi:tetratricopeptide (TPR) repeat protein